MHTVIRAASLYTFLWYCNQSPLEKTVLDCGAGGANPPLSLFLEAGYRTWGIDISTNRLKMAECFEKEHGVCLNIQEGDMRSLPFTDGSFSFIYSFNTIFHMNRDDIRRALEEMRRVLVLDGLCLVNFLSIDDGDYGKGIEVFPGSFLQAESGSETIHTYFRDEEGDALLGAFHILRKEKRVIDSPGPRGMERMAFMDYILKKG